MLSDRLTFNSKAAGADIGPNLWTWGRGNIGQLGLGDTISRSSPVQLAGQWRQVNTSGFHAFGQKASGAWYVWGYDRRGSLGLGDSGINRSSPTLIPGTWLSIRSSFGATSLGLRPDGSLWSWGYGHQGGLGLGDIISRSSPVQIAGTWKETTLFRYGGHAIRSDGSLWVWGYNSRGGLGQGDNGIHRSSPVQLAGTWLSLPSQFGRYTAGGAIKGDGSLWMWGNNEFGEGGIGIIGNISSPTQLAGTWRKISKTDGSFTAIRHDGTLWSSGYRTGGRLGLGDTISRSSPVQVGSGVWADISTGPYGVGLGLTASGSLFVWGFNDQGQLGLGDSGVNRSSPVQLAGTWKSVIGGRNSSLGMKV